MWQLREPIHAYLQSMAGGVCLMSAEFSGRHQVWKDIICNDFGDVVTKICTWETKAGWDELFKFDILKKVEEGQGMLLVKNT